MFGAPPTIDRQDFGVEIQLRNDGTPLLAYGAAIKPSRGFGNSAADKPRTLSDDLFIALEASSALEEPASEAQPLGQLGVRFGYQGDWLVADAGLQFTWFTFVFGASVGPRFDVRLGDRFAIRGQLDLHASAPLDGDLGYDFNGGLFGPTHGIHPQPTIGARARLGLGVAIVRGLELRATGTAAALLDDRGRSHTESAMVIGLGGDFRF